MASEGSDRSTRHPAALNAPADAITIPRPDPAGPAEDTRWARKHKAIMERGLATFLEKGYASSSMDEIAALAEVSKQTIYKHFADKEGLYYAIVLDMIAGAYGRFLPSIRLLSEDDDVVEGLLTFGRILNVTLLQPRMVQLRRLIIAEANRFPDLGALYYEETHGRTIELLATALQRHVERGNLSIDDPHMAAHQLCWLIFGIPRNKVMLCGDDVSYTQQELEDFADAGIRTFLAAHDPSRGDASRAQPQPPAQSSS